MCFEVARAPRTEFQCHAFGHLLLACGCHRRRTQVVPPILDRTTEVVEHREGGDPSTGRKSPGRTKFEAITLERGVTHDTEFEKWANKVWNFGSGLGAEVSAGTVEQAAAAPVVVLAVPWQRVREAVAPLIWSGQVLIDATNDFDPRDLDGRTSSEVDCGSWLSCSAYRLNSLSRASVRSNSCRTFSSTCGRRKLPISPRSVS